MHNTGIDIAVGYVKRTNKTIPMADRIPLSLTIEGFGLAAGMLEVLINGSVVMTFPVRPDGTVAFDQRPIPPAFSAVHVPNLGGGWSAPITSGTLVKGNAQDELEVRYA